jgi:4-alpha-glucanotransferase
MPKVQFIFAIHNHQPVGNFEFVAEEAYQKSYLPFVKVLERHPRIKITLHYTGILYRFFEDRHPEFIDLLKDFVRDGRAEILSGGFYEPILAVLPDDDKIGQIRTLTDYIHGNIGFDARGMWLAERVWEPHLPKIIAAAGINHVVVDDFHFKMAGLSDDELDGYFVTDEQNGMLRIFPGSERLRYLIPFHQPEETIEYLAGHRSAERHRLAVMADDGEKFGVWPETYRSVYEEGWLERFFTLLERNSDWLETTTFAEFQGKEPARGRVYLPTASYMEMGEWTLPTRAMKEYEDALLKAKEQPAFQGLRPFIKGGIWRNFLAKYPESNRMHKRMLMASAKVHEARALLAGSSGRKNADAARMLDHLYQAQCNDAYWHGVFGGLYLPHLRSAIYEHIIQAEALADKALKTAGTKSRGAGKQKREAAWLAVETGDFDRDGFEEVLLNTEALNVMIDPADGGRITELDWKPRAFNLANTLTRRPEGYHDKIVAAAGRAAETSSGGAKTIHDRITAKEEGLEAHLVYDRYERGSLIDHFLGSGADLTGFMRSEYPETGDFVGGAFAAKQKKQPGAVSLALERSGNVGGAGVRVRKEISAARGAHGVSVSYEVTNLSAEELNTAFGVEFNFSLLAGNAHDRYYEIPGHTLEKRNLASVGETNNVSRVHLVDEWLKLKLTLLFSEPAMLWRAPVETVSQSEAGFERVYQSSLVMPVWHISLRPGRSWTQTMRVDIT